MRALPPDAVVWLADVEKDKPFAEWAADAAAYGTRTLSAPHVAATRFTRHNALTALVVADPADAAAAPLASHALLLAKRHAPIRIGLVPHGRSGAALRLTHHANATGGRALLTGFLRRAAAAAAAQPTRAVGGKPQRKRFAAAGAAGGKKKKGGKKKGGGGGAVINPQALELLVDGRDSRYTTPRTPHASGRRSCGCPRAPPCCSAGCCSRVRPGDPVINPRRTTRPRSRATCAARCAACRRWPPRARNGGRMGFRREAAAAQGYDGDDAAGWLAVATASPLLSQYFESVDGTGTAPYDADDAEKWADEQLLSRLDGIDAAAAAALRGPTAYEKRRAALRILARPRGRRRSVPSLMRSRRASERACG